MTTTTTPTTPRVGLWPPSSRPGHLALAVRVGDAEWTTLAYVPEAEAEVTAEHLRDLFDIAYRHGQADAVAVLRLTEVQDIAAGELAGRNAAECDRLGLGTAAEQYHAAAEQYHYAAGVLAEVADRIEAGR